MKERMVTGEKQASCKESPLAVALVDKLETSYTSPCCKTNSSVTCLAFPLWYSYYDKHVTLIKLIDEP